MTILRFQGHPFMESLTQNKALLYSIVGSSGVVLALTLGIVPELAVQFEIIDFESEVKLKKYIYCSFQTNFFQFRMVLLQVLFADFFFSFLVDRLCMFIFGEGGLPQKIAKL